MSVDIFSLSDEELMKLDPSTLVDDSAEDKAADQDPVTDEGTGESAADADTANEAAADDAATGEDADKEEQGAGQGEAVGAGDEGAKAPDAAAEGQATEVKAENKEEANEAKPEVPAATTEKPESQVDIEGEYKKLLAPFTANGKEMSVRNVDEAITLMQMGANYNKKMAALAPNLKIVKLLESHGLTDPEKINYLIDLANKDAGAINKLVRDSGIDPMDLSSEKADGYQTKVRTVNDKELELDAVLEEIQDTNAYQRTLTVVGKEWDDSSRKVVAEAPQLLKVINSHVQTGIYDLIVTEVQRERAFGRLRGLSDIEAYRQVGDAIQARRGFDHLVSGAGNQGQQTPAPKTVVVPPNPKQAVDEAKLNEKRRAAGSTKPAGQVTSTAAEFNPLSMSDEDFLKQVKPNFL